MAGAAPGGALLIDDVEKNAATDRFLRKRPSIPAALFFAEDKEAMIAALVKPAS